MDSNFFRKSMPYGIEKSKTGYWTSFNRNYEALNDPSLGFSDYDADPKLRYHLGCVFVDLEDSDLMMMACRVEAIQRNSDGSIYRVFFYHDGSNPTNTERPEDWKKYFSRLKILAKYAVK